MSEPKFTREQLLEKARLLLSQAQYAPPINLFMIEATIEAKNTTDEQLENICKLLEEHNQKQAEIYREYKEEMKQALAEYLASVSKPKG